MANEFNPQLSKARMQKAGVVDETAGGKYEIASNLLTGSVNEFQNYQVRNFNEEADAILNTDYTESEQDNNAAVADFDNEIRIQAMREEQGITNAQQKAFNLNKKAAEAKRLAPDRAAEIDKKLAQTLKMTGGAAGRGSSAMNLRTQAEEAKANVLKTYEEDSFRFFGKSVSQLTDKQWAVLSEYNRADVANKINDVELKTDQIAFDRQELDTKKAKLRDDENTRKINLNMDNKLIALNNVFAEAMSTEGLTLDAYNESIAAYQKQGTTILNSIAQSYANAGLPVDQDYLNSVQTRIEDNVKNFESYKELTPEKKNLVKMDTYLKMAQVEQARQSAELSAVDAMNKRLNLAERKSVSNLLHPDNSFAKTNAKKHFPTLYENYVSADGKFDGLGLYSFITNAQDKTGFTLEKEMGENNSVALSAAVAKIKNFGLPNNATNLVVDSEADDPQTNAISYLSEKQIQRAEEAVAYAGKALVSLPFVISNLSMVSSKNYDFGTPNTELASTRVSKADQMLKTSVDYISKVVAENPDGVSVSGNEIVFSDEKANRAIREMYIIAEKVKDIPNAREQVLDNITQIKKNAIESTIINPKKEAIENELATNPIYAQLTPAERTELMNTVIKQDRDIQMAIGEQERQGEQVRQIAREFGKSSYFRESGALTAMHNLDRLISSGASGKEKVNALAYFGLQLEGIKEKASANIEKIGRELFGDSIQEKVEAAYDKKMGLKRTQARMIKQIQGKQMDDVKAQNIYEQMLPRYEELEMREAMGEDLVGQDAELFKYYGKFIDAYNKSYEPIEFVNLGETTRLDTEATQITEDIMAREEAATETTEANPYKLTFDNEVSRGKVDSRELHLPSNTSGVTLGAGYDMRDKTPDEIVADLTSIGLSEQDAKAISGAAGLTGDEAESFIDNNEGIEITDEQEQALFNEVIGRYEEKAVSDYDSLAVDNKPSYEELPETVKQLLVDYSYNVGVSEFPVFFEALVKGDKDTALKEYKRYTDGKPLGRRNKDTLKVLNSYDFTDLTQ